MNRYPADRYLRPPRCEPYTREPVVPPFEQLDPGVRELVRVLWLAGFNPTDSGDGVSKPADERVLDVPHVFMTLLHPADLYAEANRLHAFVADVIGFCVDAIGTTPEQLPAWRADRRVATIEASYDPATGTAVLTLLGVDDSMLPSHVFAKARLGHQP